MGAATTMMVAGEPQRPYVKCFVEDCGYTSVWDEFSNELKTSFGLPAFPPITAAVSNSTKRAIVRVIRLVVITFGYRSALSESGTPSVPA